MNDISDTRQKKRPRSKKNRETKFCLVFDEKDRVEFLTGFKKRKDERRKRAHEQMIDQLKEEKRNVKQKKLEEMRNRRQHERGVPEVDHILKSDEIDLPRHTVTVTEVEPLVLDAQRLGFNKGSDCQNELGDEKRPGTHGNVKSTRSCVSTKKHKGGAASKQKSKHGGGKDRKHGRQHSKHGGRRRKPGAGAKSRGDKNR